MRCSCSKSDKKQKLRIFPGNCEQEMLQATKTLYDCTSRRQSVVTLENHYGLPLSGFLGFSSKHSHRLDALFKEKTTFNHSQQDLSNKRKIG